MLINGQFSYRLTNDWVHKSVLNSVSRIQSTRTTADVRERSVKIMKKKKLNRGTRLCTFYFVCFFFLLLTHILVNKMSKQNDTQMN